MMFLLISARWQHPSISLLIEMLDKPEINWPEQDRVINGQRTKHQCIANAIFPSNFRVKDFQARLQF